MNSWTQAKKELRKAGIIVKTSLKGCCLGCRDNGIPDDTPAIYQLGKRFSNKWGGYLCHQDIGDTLTALTVMKILSNNKIEYKWDGSQAHSIFISLEEGN
jgi:hypothetical protein